MCGKRLPKHDFGMIEQVSRDYIYLGVFPARGVWFQGVLMCYLLMKRFGASGKPVFVLNCPLQREYINELTRANQEDSL